MITAQLVVGTVLAVGGFCFLSFMLIWLWLGHSSRHWPTAQGEILDSRAELDPTSTSDPPGHRPKVRYHYRVNDLEYSSENFTYKVYSMTRQVVEEMVGRYPTGSQVQVHYHPWHPKWAVLEPGTTLKNYRIPVLVAVGIFAAGITLILGIVGPSGD